MRIDKYLKVSRIIKRRTLAKEATSGERILVNDRQVKPSYIVKIGDIITILFGNKQSQSFEHKWNNQKSWCMFNVWVNWRKSTWGAINLLLFIVDY